MSNIGNELSQSLDPHDLSADDTVCASGSSQPRQRVSRTPTGSPVNNHDGSPGRSNNIRDDSWSRASENPRCERHRDRTAELYCQTCGVCICITCATCRHLQTSGHYCLDIDDTVDHFRSRLAQRASELDERRETCLCRIDETNVRIESIRSKLCCLSKPPLRRIIILCFALYLSLVCLGCSRNMWISCCGYILPTF